MPQEEVVFRMVLDASDLQRIMSVGPGQVGGAAGQAAAAGGTGGTGATTVRPDPSFMSIFKPLVALEAIKVGISTLVENSQVMSAYLGAFKKVIGAAVDLLLAPLTPFLNVAMLFMTTLLQALIQSGLFTDLLMWSQSIAKDMSTWITEHAPQIKAAVKQTVEVLKQVFGAVGTLISTVVEWWQKIYGWLDKNLGPVGGTLKEILKYGTIAAGVMATGLLPGAAGAPGRMAFGAARGIGMMGAGAVGAKAVSGGGGGGIRGVVGGGGGLLKGLAVIALAAKAGEGMMKNIQEDKEKGVPMREIIAGEWLTAAGGGIKRFGGGVKGLFGGMLGGGGGGGAQPGTQQQAGPISGSYNIINIDQTITGGGEDAAEQALETIERETGATMHTRS